MTQEEVAEQLDMSVNGYGDIEHGLSDIKLSRLQQIADLFDVELAALFEDGSKNTFNLLGTDNTGTQNNQKHCVINPSSQEYSELQNELDKQMFICSHKGREIEMKNQEINYLKEINQFLKNGGNWK